MVECIIPGWKPIFMVLEGANGLNWRERVEELDSTKGFYVSEAK